MRVFVRIRIFRIGGIYRISLVRLALFGITGNPAKPNTDKRLQIKDEPVESCKSYNPVNPDSDNARRGANAVPNPLDSRFRGNDGGRERE